MTHSVEMYLIGKRISRQKLIFLFLIDVLIGGLIGFYFQSIMITLLCIVFCHLLTIILTKKEYWIICTNGVFVPFYKGWIIYTIIIYRYLLKGDEQNSFIFISYRHFHHMQLQYNHDILQITLYTKDQQTLDIQITSQNFNQDLINAINYIRKKGILVENIQLLEHVHTYKKQ